MTSALPQDGGCGANICYRPSVLARADFEMVQMLMKPSAGVKKKTGQVRQHTASLRRRPSSPPFERSLCGCCMQEILKAASRDGLRFQCVDGLDIIPGVLEEAGQLVLERDAAISPEAQCLSFAQGIEEQNPGWRVGCYAVSTGKPASTSCPVACTRTPTCGYYVLIRCRKCVSISKIPSFLSL